MDLSIIILNWKVRDLLKECLQSVYRETVGLDFEVIVIDNNSEDGSVEMVREEFPQAKLIVNNRNLGFSKGNNQGIDIARGDFVLLLNPDTKISGDVFTKMVGEMRADSNIGVLGPKLLNKDGSIQPSVRRFPKLLDQIMVMLKLLRLFYWTWPMKQYLSADFDYSKIQEVDQIMGAVFLIRRELIEKIGGLDSKFFVWFEEVDYCKRTKEAGYKVVYTPVAEVTHYGGDSFAQEFGITKQRYWNNSMRTYFKKHYGWSAWFILLLLYLPSMLLAGLVQLFSKPIKK